MWKDIFQKGISFKQRLGYLFGPPGWSHDGSRLTSEEMRIKEAAETEDALKAFEVEEKHVFG